MELVDRFLAAVVSDDPGALADCYAPHVVIEMPFAVPGLMPARVETTREELRARFRAGRSVRHYTAVSDVHVVAAGPDVVLEYQVQGTMVATGGPFTLRFAMVMTLQDGLIAHSRDYTDPIAGARALGRLPELAATLQAEAA